MRTCKKCGATRALEEFTVNRRLKDGRAYECKPCTHERQRRWRQKNPGAAKAIRDRWNAANSEQVKRINQAYYLSNKARVEATARAWREANPERWANLIRVNSLRRAARKREVPHFKVTNKDLRRILSAPCAVPGCTRTDMQIDHVLPISRGGSHGVGNLQPLCGHHNASKNDRTWMEYRVYLRRTHDAA